MWERPPRLAILLFALFAAVPVWAQDDVDGDGVGDVVVEGARDDIRAPSSFTTDVDVDPLIDRGEQLATGLGAAAGVSVRRAGADGSGAVVTVRGASSGQVLVTLGGVPLNPARGGGLDLDLIPPSLLGDIKVHRGGSALRFGRGAIGGAVELEPVSDGSWATLGVGSFGAVRSGVGVVAGDRELSGLVALDGLRTDGDFLFEDEQGSFHRRRNADVDRLGTVASATWRPSPKWRLRLTDLASVTERGRPGPAEFQVALDGARSQALNNTAGLNARRYDLAALGPATVDLEVTLGHSLRTARYRNPDRLLRSEFGFDSRYTERSAYGSAVVSVWGEDLGVFAGADGRWETLGTRSTGTDGVWRRAEHERPTSGGFVSAVWELGPLTTSGGARVEGVRGLEPQVSPAIGAAVDVGGGFSVRGNAARAWRAPSFDELHLDEELVVGDPDLRPESALSADLGLRFEARKAFVEGAVFWLEVEDLILFLPVSPTLYRAQNTGAARSVGAELSWETGVGPIGWDGAYTFTVARFGAAPQDPLPGRPRHRLRAEVSYTLGPFEAFARARARSRVYLDNFANLRDEAAVYYDAGAVGRPAPGWSVAVVGENLTDVRTSQDHLQQPLPGLVWKVQVTARGPGL
jgi:vitamin B12 transporter